MLQWFYQKAKMILFCCFKKALDLPVAYGINPQNTGSMGSPIFLWSYLISLFHTSLLLGILFLLSKIFVLSLYSNVWENIIYLREISQLYSLFLRLFSNAKQSWLLPHLCCQYTLSILVSKCFVSTTFW